MELYFVFLEWRTGTPHWHTAVANSTVLYAVLLKDLPTTRTTADELSAVNYVRRIKEISKQAAFF
jgi:lysine/ornithine N-monooxygenase